MLTCAEICCQDTVIQNIVIAWKVLLAKGNIKEEICNDTFNNLQDSISCCKMSFLFHACKWQIKIGQSKADGKTVFIFFMNWLKSWGRLAYENGSLNYKTPWNISSKYISTTGVFSTSWTDTTVLVLNFSEVCSLSWREHTIKFRC